MIYVSNVDGTWVFKSSNNEVDDEGNITIEEGDDVNIFFQPDAGQTWTFVPQWVAISPMDGDVSFVSGTASQVEIRDNNSKAPESEYEYTLYTSIGPADPRIINKGTSGMKRRRPPMPVPPPSA